MTREADTHIVYVAASNVRPGWCDACLKPSMVSADVVALADDGLSVIADASECRDCGAKVALPPHE